MRNIGDQWIEEIDGKKHMLKAVQGESCNGCAFGKMHKGSGLNDIHVCDREDDCPLEYADTIVKDLGILNGDGCLPSDFGIYPEVYGHTLMGIDGYMAKAYASDPHVGKYAWGNTRQEAIDAWNKRN